MPGTAVGVATELELALVDDDTGFAVVDATGTVDETGAEPPPQVKTLGPGMV